MPCRSRSWSATARRAPDRNVFVGLVAVRDERPGASEQPSRPRCPRRRGSFRQPRPVPVRRRPISPHRAAASTRSGNASVPRTMLSWSKTCRRGSQRGVVPTGAELENGERGVGMVDADALRRARARPASCAERPVRVASSFPCHASRSTCAGAGAPSSPREPVSETTSSISARCDAADPRRPWRTSSQLRKLSASGSAASAPVARASCTHCMGEVVPGPVVEDCRQPRQDGVEVHDMDVAAGDRLRGVLDLGPRWSRPRAGLDIAAVFTGQHARRYRRPASQVGSAMSQRSMTVSVPAAIAAPCGLFDEVATGERRGVGGDTRAGRRARCRSAPIRGQRAGQQRRGLPDVPGDDVDQRLGPCGVGVDVRRRVRSPGRDRGSLRACGP